MAPGKIVTRVGLRTDEGVALLDKQHVCSYNMRSQSLRSSAFELLNVTSKLSLPVTNGFDLSSDFLQKLLSRKDFDLIVTESPECVHIDSDLFNREVFNVREGGVEIRVGRLNVANQTQTLELNVPVVSVSMKTNKSTTLQLHAMHVGSASTKADNSDFFMQSYIYNGSFVALNVRNMLRKHVPVNGFHMKNNSSHFDTRTAVTNHHRKLMRDLSLGSEMGGANVRVTPHSIQCSTDIDTKSDVCGNTGKCQFQTIYLKL